MEKNNSLLFMFTGIESNVYICNYVFKSGIGYSIQHLKIYIYDTCNSKNQPYLKYMINHNINEIITAHYIMFIISNSQLGVSL